MTLSVGPKLGLLVHGALGEQHYDELMAQWRALDTLIQCNVISMTLATPPGSPADGDTYIVAASPTDAWAGKATNLARWSAVLGDWEFFAPKEGWKAYCLADDLDYRFDGAVWVVASSGGGGSGIVESVIAGAGVTVDDSDPANPVVNIAGANVVTEATVELTATSANAGNYTRFTNASPKAYNFDSAQTYSVGAEYHARNVGAGDIVLTQVGSFVLNPPADGSLIVPQGGTVTVKIVAAQEADVFGVTGAP